MKKLGLLVLLFVFTHAARCQTTPAPLPDSVQAFLDKSLTLLETYSLERGTVNWPQLRQAVQQKAQGAQSVRELLPIYPFVFEQLKDDHGWLTYQGKTYKWRNTARPAYPNTAVKAALAKKPGVLVKMLPGNVGYVQLPGINAGGSLQAMRDAAQVVQDSLCRLNPNQAQAWIIDLRLNDGGAMAPMLAGIAPPHRRRVPGRLRGQGRQARSAVVPPPGQLLHGHPTSHDAAKPLPRQAHQQARGRAAQRPDRQLRRNSGHQPAGPPGYSLVRGAHLRRYYRQRKLPHQRQLLPHYCWHAGNGPQQSCVPLQRNAG